MTLSIKPNLRILLFIGLIWITESCRTKTQKEIGDPISYSKNQRYLFNLLDNYKADYIGAKRQGERDTIQNIYLAKLSYFLVDSLGRYIDSINVTVDTVFQEGWLVTTQFHSRDIEFKYGMTFKDNMNSKWDSLYKWMRNLKVDSNLTVNFVHLGSGELNFPDDKTKSTIKIFAYPEPLKMRPQ